MLFFKQKTAYDLRISDWSSDLCSSDLAAARRIDDHPAGGQEPAAHQRVELYAQDSRGHSRPAHRRRVHKAADTGTLSQPDIPGPERLWRAGGLARLFRQGRGRAFACRNGLSRSEEHTSELQSLMRISYAVFCLKKKKIKSKN